MTAQTNRNLMSLTIVCRRSGAPVTRKPSRPVLVLLGLKRHPYAPIALIFQALEAFGVFDILAHCAGECHPPRPARSALALGAAAGRGTKSLWRTAFVDKLSVRKTAVRLPGAAPGAYAKHPRKAGALVCRRAGSQAQATRIFGTRSRRGSPDETRHGQCPPVARWNSPRCRRLPCTEDRSAGRFSRGRTTAIRSYAEWPSACSSTPRIRKKHGWWS